MFFRTTALTAALLASTSLSHASEGKVFLDELAALAKVNGTEITWGSIIEENSSSFILTDVSIKNADGRDTTIKNVVVRGLKEANGRLTYDTITIGEVNGTTDTGGKLGFAGIVSTAGDWPSNIWEDGLTAEEKRQRIKFGNFTVNGMALDDEGVKVTLDTVVLTNADIPLDFRFDPNEAAESTGEPAAPLTFDQFAMKGLNGSNDSVTFGLQSFTMADANVPTTSQGNIEEWMKIYSSVLFNGITASIGPTEVLNLESFGGTIDPPSADGTYQFNSQLTGLNVDLNAIPDPQTQDVFRQLGYERLQGEMTASGTYNLTTGRVAMPEMVMKFKDMFDLSMNYSINGYTKEVAEKLQSTQLEVASGRDPAEAYGAAFGELGNVKLENFKIALTDRSLTGKLLDFQAQQMGTTGDQLAAGAPMMIGLGMGGLNMPGLTEMVTSAVGKFLKEKGTLTIEAVPQEPVPILNVVLTGQSDPTKIPELVNLQITAE